MKRIGAAILALFVVIALGACTEVPVKKVEKCSKVVDVKMFQRYFLRFLPEQRVNAYKILENGNRVWIDPANYYQWGVYSWLETAKRMEIGNNYCWIEYERIK